MSQAGSEQTGEGLVQQRLFQRLQRGVLPLVEAGEALGGGFAHGFRSISDGLVSGLATIPRESAT